MHQMIIQNCTHLILSHTWKKMDRFFPNCPQKGPKGAFWPLKWVKMCPSPCKSRYKCYLRGKCHMSDGKNVKMTPFDISPKFTLFWGSKWVKKCPSPYITRYKCYFLEYVTREVGKIWSWHLLIYHQNLPCLWGIRGLKVLMEITCKWFVKSFQGRL